MRGPNENAADSLGNLGAPIRPDKPAEPDKAKTFERGNFHKDGSLIGNTNTAVQTIVDTLRKKAERDEQTNDLIVSDGCIGDWEGMCVDVSGFGLTAAAMKALDKFIADSRGA